MSFSTPDLNLDETLRLAKQYGYDGLEPRIDAGHKHGIEVDAGKVYLTEAKKKAEDIGIAYSCIATSCSYADPSSSIGNIEKTKKALELAAQIGAPVIRVFGGQIPDSVSRNQSADSVTNALIQLSAYAEQCNVTVCIETHDSWCHPKHIAEILKNVNHPYIAANWDLMHPMLTALYPIDKSYELLKSYIKHVHVHDGVVSEKGREMVPMGTGVVDHKTALQLLKEAGYAGYVSGEWINWEPYEIHLPREIEIMRSYLK